MSWLPTNVVAGAPCAVIQLEELAAEVTNVLSQWGIGNSYEDSEVTVTDPFDTEEDL